MPLEEVPVWVAQQWCQWFLIVGADATISDTEQDCWPFEGAGPTGEYQIPTPKVRQINEITSYLQEVR